MKEIIDKLDLAKIKNFYSARDSIWRNRRQATDLEKILANNTRGKGLLSKIPRTFKLSSKKATWLESGPKNLTPHQRRYTDSRYTYEKMLHIICH